jgi:hypothetical protein
MKIEKLYTLSQFVEIIENELDPKNFRGNRYNWPGLYNHLEAVFKYNEFLKQPLKKEMFVNDIPVAIPFETSTDKDLWIEREKKVIFEGFKVEHSKYKQTEREIIWLNKVDQLFRKLVFHSGEIKEWESEMTFNDLAELTTRELKLKNVNI